MKKLRKIIRKTKEIINNQYYVHYYNKKVKDKYILLESKTGKDIAGNIFHILKELQKPAYSQYKIFLVCHKTTEDKIVNILRKNNIVRFTVVEHMSKRYFKYLGISKYLFTDTTFSRRYVKKEGQIVVNTWHGTPLKKMGKDVANRVYAIGNVKRNLLMSDYLVMPNDYMIDVMVNAYGLQQLYEGKILCEGYPRNSVFFDKNVGASIRTELGLDGKEVFVYMPTWRGTLTNKSTEHFMDMMEYYLFPLDRYLKDNQVLYVKLHPFVENAVDFSRFSHIKKYDTKYDVYEFLNISDVLITDYSSVFYDFANTGKKIILFAYDETQYLSERGVYKNLREYPFPVVKKVADLVKELNLPKQYDDTQFLKECCTYDGAGAAERICQHTIKGEKVCKEMALEKNGKENVLIFNSSLWKNGLTTSMLNLFQCIDLNKRNYFITFRQRSLKKFPYRVGIIPGEVDVIPTSNDLDQTFFEALAFQLYYRFNNESRFVQRYLDRMYRRELRKFFPSIRIDTAIQFAGYEKKMTGLFQRFDCRRVIYVHNDMIQEMKSRNNQHYLTLRSAYSQYDKVAVVTEDIMPPTVEIAGNVGTNKLVVNNCHAYQEVIERANLEVEYNDDTNANIGLKELKDILNSDAKKFVTIGRFSYEKGHMMLMKAFEKFSKTHPNHYLIIVGGHGNLYSQTLSYADESDANIIIIKSMMNPMPILRKSDFFILSSYYEGLGLTLLEADAVGIPSMSTNVQGPRGFVKAHHGVLVEPNEESIYRGMLDFMDGKIQAMNVDYEEYNANAVKQFESLFQD